MSQPADPRMAAPQEEPSLLQRARAAPITFGLVALNAAAFLWAETHGGTSRAGTLVHFGALEPLHVWAGAYWRLVTYMFMHQGWIHLLMNMYVLVGWGAVLERALGKRRFSILYLLAGIGGGAASLVSGLLFELHSSVGASGALFGIIGAVLAVRRRQLGSFRAFVEDRAIRSLLLQIGLWTVIGSVALHLDNAAHFGGFAVGFAVCWLYGARPARGGWVAFAAAFALLLGAAVRPW